MYRILINSALFIMLSISSAVGQNYVLPENESAFHGSVQLTNGSFERIISIQPGYTWNGVITAGVDLGKGTDNVLNQTLNIVRPNLNYLIIKQSSGGSPISFNLEAAYQFNILPTTTFNSRSVQFGGALFHQISINDESINASLIPQAGLLAVQTTNRNGFQVETGLGIIYNAGVTVLWQDVYIEPTIFINSGNLSYSLKVGYIL